MNDETWLPVTGYENLYEVSNLGRVRSVARKNTKGAVMRVADDGHGYLNVKLYKNGKTKNHKVHRLVCTAFHENPLNLPQVNHKNECKTDNRAENLEWCDAMYNNHYGMRLERLSTPVYQYDLDGAPVACHTSTAEAARKTKVSQGNISRCARGECKTQGGYQWRYEPALFLDATECHFNNAQSKHVYQYSLEGRFVKEWPSVGEIHRQTEYDSGQISRCCNGMYRSAYGFRWFYEYRGSNLNATKPSHELSKLF